MTIALVCSAWLAQAVLSLTYLRRFVAKESSS